LATVRKFEELDLWKLSRKLCIEIGLLIDSGDFKQHYRLISQIEGATGSIMDNIAEGFERGTRGEFIQFLGYAKGSCGEFRSQLYRCFDRELISKSQFEMLISLAIRISQMLQKFIVYLQKTTVKGVRKL
jgi:four helix bundle protein